MRAASFGTQSLLKGAWEKEETNMEYRRRVPRERAGWDGLCQIEGELATHCKVDDISMFGLGLTLNYSFPPQPEGRRNVYAGTTIGDSVTELVGRRISVDVPAVGDSVTSNSRVSSPNAKRMSGEVVRVGIEFDRLAEPASETTALSELSEQAAPELFSPGKTPLMLDRWDPSDNPARSTSSAPPSTAQVPSPPLGSWPPRCRRAQRKHDRRKVTRCLPDTVQHE